LVGFGIMIKSGIRFEENGYNDENQIENVPGGAIFE
jgi:hypothetical protein